MKPHPIPPATWPTREEAAKSLLFSPLRVGAFTARHRTWVPAMVPWRATADGDVTRDVLDWYGRFADGRPGVLVVEATGIRDVPSGPLLRIGHDRFLPGLRELVRTVRERSGGETRLLVQIIDFLAIKRRPRKEDFLRRFLAVEDRHAAALDERGIQVPDEAAVREALVALPHDELLAVVADRVPGAVTVADGSAEPVERVSAGGAAYGRRGEIASWGAGDEPGREALAPSRQRRERVGRVQGRPRDGPLPDAHEDGVPDLEACAGVVAVERADVQEEEITNAERDRQRQRLERAGEL